MPQEHGFLLPAMGAGHYYFSGENMATIKRTSPGPKIGPTGSTIGAPKNVGTTGPRNTSTSTTGGQHSFMPSPKGMQGAAKRGSGQTSSGRENYYDFMPKKAGGK
jgi:hypothetical protein